MADFLARLQDELNLARKAHDKIRTVVLGTIISEIKNREIEVRRDLSDEDAVDVIRKSIKKRRESIDAFTKAGRMELVEREQAELALLDVYLPPAVDPEEVRVAVKAAIAAGAANVGALMGKVMPQFKGRVDGTVINQIAREELAAKG
jgi:uncharacterized protein YqeY